MSLFKKPEAKPWISELRKDCIYIIMLPADQRQEFLEALESLDLTQGPEILVLDEMGITIMEFAKESRQASAIHIGKLSK